jgi:hypothetical protein
MTALPHGYSEADTKPSDAVVAKSTVCVGGASRLASQHTESIQISASTRPPVSATSPLYMSVLLIEAWGDVPRADFLQAERRHG